METPYSLSPTHFRDKTLTGRNRRLLYEWQAMEEGLSARSDIRWRVERVNAEGLPVAYCIDYLIRSICGVNDVERLNQPGVCNTPIYADCFRMRIDLPDAFPCVDGAPVYQFLTKDEQGQPIPHPWHPNIRFFGAFAGRVCLNRADTFTDLVWGVKRVADYLTYERYHALSEPPYPEDLQVAAWVIRQAEPNGWVN
ncbi:MAG: hypothetical protein J5884_00780 [Paludibacteraceae bacterium]|nr:hypothetical protein [Paludibacteraceae bacterium]